MAADASFRAKLPPSLGQPVNPLLYAKSGGHNRVKSVEEVAGEICMDRPGGISAGRDTAPPISLTSRKNLRALLLKGRQMRYVSRAYGRMGPPI